MKSKMFFLLPVFLCVFLTQMNGQRRMNNTLDYFLRSDFMHQFRKMRTDAENTIFSFKAKQSQYDPSGVQRVSEGYNATAARFNKILREIADDFASNRNKSPYARENLMYKLRYEMRDLKDFYAQNFVQVIRDVKGEYSNDGSALLLALPVLSQAFGQIFGQMAQIKQQNIRVSRDLVEKKLYRANRFPSWDEIRVAGAGGQDAYIPEDSNINNQGMNDPIFEESFPQNQTGGYTDPYNQGNFDPNQPNYNNGYGGNQQNGYPQYNQGTQKNGYDMNQQQGYPNYNNGIQGAAAPRSGHTQQKKVQPQQKNVPKSVAPQSRNLKREF